MQVTVDNSTKAIKSIVTVDFNGSIDFNIDENGLLVDGEKTITHQELYDMVKPVEEVIEVEEERLETDELESEFN